jgi:hypothetical protein
MFGASVVNSANLHTFAVFEIDDMAGKIRCKECFEADPHKTDWMVRNSHKRHLTQSLEHKANVTANHKRREAEAAGHAQYQSIYSTQTFANLNSGPGPSNIAPPMRPALFDPGDEMPDLANSIDYVSVYDPFHMAIPSAGIAPRARNPEFERERLRREVELLLADAEHADIWGHDEEDATVTNIENEFVDLGATIFIDIILRHLRKPPDIQSDYEPSDPFAESGTDSEYTPYPNRLVS